MLVQEEQEKVEVQNASLQAILRDVHRQLDTYEERANQADTDMRRHGTTSSCLLRQEQLQG